jgi:hypothetical protein
MLVRIDAADPFGRSRDEPESGDALAAGIGERAPGA